MPHNAKIKEKKSMTFRSVQLAMIKVPLRFAFLLNISCAITKTNIIMIMRHVHKAKTRISLDVRTEQVKVNRNGSSISTLL